jgi:hypothetical protein
MLLRTIGSIFIGTALLTSGPANAAPVGTVLDGRWSGGEFDIRIDAERSQANLDPEKPFKWERFIVKDATGSRVVFTIGARLFMAELTEDAMTITGFDFPGEVILNRQVEPEISADADVGIEEPTAPN